MPGCDIARSAFPKSGPVLLKHCAGLVSMGRCCTTLTLTLLATEYEQPYMRRSAPFSLYGDRVSLRVDVPAITVKGLYEECPYHLGGWCGAWVASSQAGAIVIGVSIPRSWNHRVLALGLFSKAKVRGLDIGLVYSKASLRRLLHVAYLFGG